MLGNTIRILVGLPGAGKTTFAEGLNDYKTYYHVFDFDKKTVKEIETEFKDYFKAAKSWKFEIEDFVIDGLFLTKTAIYGLIDTFIKSNCTFEENNYRIILDVWEVDRDACLYNDKMRGREQDALITINNAIVDVPTVEELTTYYNNKKNLTFEINRHKTIKMNIIEKFKQDHYLSDDILTSETWSLGGTIGSCWDGEEGPTHISGEPEKEFIEFDELIELLAPNISFLQYKNLFHKVASIKTIEYSDYYGGHTENAHWEANISDTINYLKKKNLLEVDIDE